MRRTMFIDKKCRDCNVDLTVANAVANGTSRHGKKIFQNRCRACWRIYTRDNAKKPSDIRQRQLYRKQRTLAKFGVTVAQYEVMLIKQSGVCAICAKAESSIHWRTGKPKALAVDHCHATGKTRKLLCSRCNRILGWLEEKPELFQAFIAYIEENSV